VRIILVDDGKATNLLPDQTGVDEGIDNEASRQAGIQGLSTQTARTDHVERHHPILPQPDTATPDWVNRVPNMRRVPATSRAGRWYAGVAILVLFAAWELVVASAAHTHAGPAIGTVVLTAAAIAVARLTGAWHVALPSGLVTVTIFLADVLSPTAFTGKPLAGPVGYGNADGILDALGVAAALIAAVSLRGGWRIPWVAVAVALTVFSAETKSVAGASLAIVLLVVGCAALVVQLSAPLTAAVAAVAILAVIAMTVVLGLDYHPGRSQQPRLDRIAAGSLTYDRIKLWHDAVEITRHHPVVGVGPQRFAVASPTARSDRDLRWAHSGPLQQAAEAGVPGVLLLAALFGWALVLLGATRTSQAAIGAAAVGALGVHCGIDYVLHFLVVPVTAGAIVGSAAASVSPRRLRPRTGRPGSPG